MEFGSSELLGCCPIGLADAPVALGQTLQWRDQARVVDAAVHVAFLHFSTARSNPGRASAYCPVLESQMPT